MVSFLEGLRALMTALLLLAFAWFCLVGFLSLGSLFGLDR